MAVVINDMEVAPQPAAPEAAGTAGQAGGESGGRDLVKLVEKKLQVKRTRMHRLEAN